jgi:quercetin dioxygenase-like cupin family protein
VIFELDELKFSATAALFEGLPQAGIGISIFVVRTPPGGAVELHTHPYSETFILLAGSVHESGTLDQTFLGREPA